MNDNTRRHYVTKLEDYKVEPSLFIYHSFDKFAWMVLGLVACVAMGLRLPFFFFGAGFAVFAIFDRLQKEVAYLQMGELNPAIVVNTQPFLVAIYADMNRDNTQASRPMIKIVRAPNPSNKLQHGQWLGAICNYVGYAQQHYWSDFTPTLLNTTTSDDAVIKQAMGQIPVEKWDALQNGLDKIGEPLQEGVYLLKDSM